MSRPRYPWWGYIKNIIRLYPARVAEYDLLKSAPVTPNYAATGHGSGISKPTEQAALKEFPPYKQREYDAVRLAVTQISAFADGDDRIKLAEMMYWKRTHTLCGAAYKLNISERTARRWNKEFVYLVAEKMGLWKSWP